LGKRIPGRGRRPGLVVLLLCLLAVGVPARGQGDSPPIPGGGAAESEAGVMSERADFALKPWTEIRRHRARPLYTRPAGLLLFLPGPLFFLAVLLLPAALRRKWPALPLILPGLREAETAFAVGEIGTAAALFEAALKRDFPDNPALLYNLAVCRHLLRERGRAIHLLRKGLAVKPGDRMLRQTLLSLEREYGLSGQLAPPPPLAAGLPYALAACFSNLAFIAGALFYRRRRVQLLILLVLLVTVALVSLGLYLTLRSRERQSVGVVDAATAELKVIPRSNAGSRLQLAEGTSLHVLGEDEGFVLVETGFGFKGWVEQRVLLID
jgi:tetratricopeptide (TPR) repeat protein